MADQERRDECWEPRFTISIIAAMLEIHPQTLRLYERMGLIRPQRRGHIRMFCEADIERLRQIQRLKNDLGVNLAGIEVILRLLDRIEELQAEVERVRAQAKRRLKRITQEW
ncbi:MAG: putative heat shock protein HspR [bacterium ADurb.Bin429]|nr:MAG: putative heat shock protein HspR [bacterium ADurb.Bin429]